MNSRCLGACAALLLGVQLAFPAPADSADQPDLSWYRATLVQGYEKHGRKDTKWDSEARAAFESYVPIKAGVATAGDAIDRTLAPHLKAAVEAGCDDPYLQYLHLRFVSPGVSRTAQATAEVYRQLVPRMQATGYPAMCRFYVTLRGAQALAALRTEPGKVAEMRQQAIGYLKTMLWEETLPPREVDEALGVVADALANNAAHLRAALEALDSTLAVRWPKLACVPLFKGRVHIKLAWADRGTGFADSVTEEGWKGFEKNISLAQKALEEAWKLDDKDVRIPIEMITVELAQGQGRTRMELWFSRAMALDPSSHEACEHKRYYLEPKWHGSAREMLAFGRECVESETWKGRVPLVLIDVHEALARYIKDPEGKKAYWKRSEVWTDLKRAFEKFFQLNPNAVGWRHNYAKYAYQCEAWEDLNRQLKLLGPVNHEYFGGREAFDTMVASAKAHAKE